MKQLITGAILLSASLLAAQENKTVKENDPVTVRIKKVEKINGVEKITDTTYTVKGPMTLEAIDGLTSENADIKKDGKQKKIVVITDEVHGDHMKIMDKDDVTDEQVKKAIELAAGDGKNVENVITVDVDAKGEGNGGKKMTKIIIIKTTKIVEPTEADAKMLNKETGVTDGKLAVDKMNFYPNPGNGKFNLSFSLPGKGDTELTILNVEGKKVYEEKLAGFSGAYDKEIDISKNPKGVYFVRIEQGSHAQVKKVVLE